MMTTIEVHSERNLSTGIKQLLNSLRNVRKLDVVSVEPSRDSTATLDAETFLNQILSLSSILSRARHTREAETLTEVYALAVLDTNFGGLGFKQNEELTQKEESQVLFLVSAWLESLNSADRSKRSIKLLTARPEGRRGMTLSEKIFAAHDIERRGELKPGDLVRVDVDWIMASELSWSGMKKQYDSLGKPGIFRNDRFWLAGDHVVDPRIKDVPLIKGLISASEQARDDFHMTDYQGMNYTIMHTEFSRERAQPGMLIIGSDSHTCSAGSLGCLAIGLGVADVTMPLITGETWFKIPESVNIRLINAPSPGIGGKDVILYIMKELKRNTVAAERVVEYTGPGLEYLSCDARFAIANMTTEFGGITGIFAPDQTTYDFVDRRKSPRHKKDAHYFWPDEDATYIATHIIDLSKVESFIARFPSPDDVVPISELEGLHLDGCFIGACTTAEEDLILAGMVLELGLKRGLRPVKVGMRKVVPGSLPILYKLKALGITEVYEAAGFEVGIPGCSYCVGMGADRASEGEVWISSQNRNFENRMGKGAIGHIASAVSVAASSFNMKVTNPKSLLDGIDREKLSEHLGRRTKGPSGRTPTYVEPSGNMMSDVTETVLANAVSRNLSAATLTNSQQEINGTSEQKPASSETITGKVQLLGDFIDTDALAPAEILIKCKTNEEFGNHCLEHTHPEFRQRVKDGYNIVVAGNAFGCGSSRENAVSALLGAGVKCVIAKSFAFIYGRNQPNLGLLGITITDTRFYEAAIEGVSIEIDLAERKVRVGDGEWGFVLSQMEKELIRAGGLSQAFEKFGKRLFDVMCTVPSAATNKQENCANLEGLQW